MIYFDYNATYPMSTAAREAIAAVARATGGGNPSSLHAAGRLARDAVERARAGIARSLGAASAEVVFTSGGSEANQLALWGLVRARRKLDRGRSRLLVGSLEHPSVHGAGGMLVDFEVTRLENDERGVCKLPTLDERVALVSLQLANHELGTLQPVAELVRAAAAHGVWVHTDAVQAFGKVPLDFGALGVQAMSISSHKVGGPQGVGALVVKSNLSLEPIAPSGQQERGRRPGTENVLGILGFAAAVEALRPEAWSRVQAVRERLEAGLLRIGARVHGAAAERICNTCNAAFAGIDGEVLMQSLDLQGVAVSMGAACSSGAVEASPVVRALGLSAQEARQAVRFSLGPENTVEEVDRVLAMLPEMLARIAKGRRA